ncbi:site-2 protease family protein [Marinicrinis lubricantis]|uniref:Site-2 protease family protein n=1 Tax=Marinicrinis lubricantis TaxID=2086470 RepID=A0ABW1ILM8_9BACL
MPQPEKRKNWWIFGAVAIFIATKLKSILALLKTAKFAGPLISMLITIGTYAIWYPLGFSIGLVTMIFIHEMGHLIAAKLKGLPVSAPYFIPFIGAFIALKKHPRDAATEAYVAYGGPLLGTAGAVCTLLIGIWIEDPLWLVIANIGFFLNLINLIPVHPLDGGRISTAVTRWLWLIGLVLGLGLAIYLNSFIFILIWALFAWELLQKYVLKKDRKRKERFSTRCEVPLDSLAMWGDSLPGEYHRRELEFTTYSTLDGEQLLEVCWEAMNIREVIHIPQQSIIHRVETSGVIQVPAEQPTYAEIKINIELVQFENDKYYDVPSMVRLKFGAAYAGLAVFLGYMLYYTQNSSYYPIVGS